MPKIYKDELQEEKEKNKELEKQQAKIEALESDKRILGDVVLKQTAEIKKKDKIINDIKDFLENEQLELKDYWNNNDLSYEGHGRMYLIDELLEKYFE